VRGSVNSRNSVRRNLDHIDERNDSLEESYVVTFVGGSQRRRAGDRYPGFGADHFATPLLAKTDGFDTGQLRNFRGFGRIANQVQIYAQDPAWSASGHSRDPCYDGLEILETDVFIHLDMDCTSKIFWHGDSFSESNYATYGRDAH
jgi:hypothetical protein